MYIVRDNGVYGTRMWYPLTDYKDRSNLLLLLMYAHNHPPPTPTVYMIAKVTLENFYDGIIYPHPYPISRWIFLILLMYNFSHVAIWEYSALLNVKMCTVSFLIQRRNNYDNIDYGSRLVFDYWAIIIIDSNRQVYYYL